MSINLAESLVPPAVAPRHIPGRPHISTVWRWMTRGCRGITLESIVCAGRRFTSLEAIERFVAATTAAAAGEPPPTRTPRQRERAIVDAERRFADGEPPRRHRPSQHKRAIPDADDKLADGP